MEGSDNGIGAEFLDSSRERGTQTDGVNGHTAQADSFPPNPAANLAGDRRRGPSTSSLPIYAELTEDQQAYVVETIKKFYGGN